ncbi:MAG: hypothetical protein SGJ00_12985, partial [bacterium]|nr:hypothetical protein [bacterium]
MLVSNSFIISYDNSAHVNGNLFGVLGINDFSGNPTCVKESNVDLRGDFLFALGASTGTIEKTEDYFSEENGNIIIRSVNKESSHTFSMLCEKDFAVVKEATSFDDSHEDYDLGSFSIYAGLKNKKTNYLAIDPPYFGWGDDKADETNRYWMHNTIEIDNGLQAKNRRYNFPTYDIKNNGKTGFVKEFDLSFLFWSEGSLFIPPSTLRRNVLTVNEEGNIYYFINDYIDATLVPGDFQELKINVVGNGRHDHFDTYRKFGNLHIWDNSCKYDLTNIGKLTVHVGAFKSRISGNGAWESTVTSNNNVYGSRAAYVIDGNFVTRLSLHQPVRKTIFQSFYYPQLCNAQLPTVTINDSSTSHVSTRIDFIIGKDTSLEGRMGKNSIGSLVYDTISHFHLSKWEGNMADTALNPFNKTYQNGLNLIFNAQQFFLTYHTLNYMGQGYKYCPPSYAHFRTVKVDNGSYLIFKDTLFASTILLDFQSTILGKQTYSCTINPRQAVTSSDTIIIKLPDVARGVEMIAIASANDTIPSRYDSLSNYFYMAIPSIKKEFTIQEKQACQDCYFPPFGTNIDTLFEADDGNKHTLGNKKAINYPNGNMIISNATRIAMCPGVYIQNKDSLIIEGQPQSRGLQIPTCQGIEAIASASNNSMLLVPIYNKDWGYTNFAKPVANLTMRNDTLCPGEPLIICMNRILNDAMAEIKVCRWDSIFDTNGNWVLACVDDSLVLDSIAYVLFAYKGECTAYDFTELLNREQTIHKAWYISYFEE